MSLIPVSMSLHAKIDAEPKRCRAIFRASLQFRMNPALLWHVNRDVPASLCRCQHGPHHAGPRSFIQNWTQTYTLPTNSGVNKGDHFACFAFHTNYLNSFWLIVFCRFHQYGNTDVWSCIVPLLNGSWNNGMVNYQQKSINFKTRHYNLWI